MSTLRGNLQSISLMDVVQLLNVNRKTGKLMVNQGKMSGVLYVQNGDVVIAAITSCTNTSNPSVLIAAGLVAKKAVERGLRPQPSGPQTLPVQFGVQVKSQASGLVPLGSAPEPPQK